MAAADTRGRDVGAEEALIKFRGSREYDADAGRPL
jgi:hypothetical protein